MYNVTEFKSEIDGKCFVEYGISEKNGKPFAFTDSELEARRLVQVLNENEVEPNHVIDVIEDLLY